MSRPELCVCGEPNEFCTCEPPMANTTTEISRPVKCDLCWSGGIIKAAVVDGKLEGSPVWAFMCAYHWGSKGVGRLGLGLGQRLVVRASKDSKGLLLDGAAALHAQK